MSERQPIEYTDLAVRPIAVGVCAVFVLIILGLSLSALTARLVRRYRSHTDEPAVFARQGPPPAPRLQTDPAADLKAYRDRQDALLDSYEWLDRPRGVVRIPIERAMELVVRDERKRGGKP